MINYQFSKKGELSEEDIHSLNSLLGQLSADATVMEKDYFETVQEHSFLLVARDSDKNNLLIGIGCLVPIYKPIYKQGRIEDVVVDEKYRGQGIGKEISRRLIEKAKSENMKSIELSSSPFREAANHLYQSLGFEKRNTNVYQMEL